MGGTATWSFNEVMTQNSGAQNDPYFGNFGGSLVFRVVWDSGQVTKFVSDCLTEAQTIFNSPIREVELKAHGSVTGFPNNTATQDAVGKLAVKTDGDGHFKVQISLNLGRRCSEDEDNEFNLAGGVVGSDFPSTDKKETGRASGGMESPKKTAGAWAFPPGHGPFSCNGAS